MINVSTSAAATITTPTSATQTVGVNHTAPKVLGVTPGNNTIVSTCPTVKVIFTKNVTSGSQNVLLKNGNSVVPTKNIFSGKILYMTPSIALSEGVRYYVIFNANSVIDEFGNENSYYNSSFTVSPITLLQMKDGQNRAQVYFNNNQRLPNYVSYGSTHILIAQFQKIIATQGLKINTKITNPNASLASIMKGAAKYGYSHSASTAAAMERIGAGDCWAMSDYLYTKMTAAHMTARIIQYPTSYVNNHRSVQYLSNGAWVNAPYRQYFSTDMFNNTQSTGMVIRCG